MRATKNRARILITGALIASTLSCSKKEATPTTAEAVNEAAQDAPIGARLVVLGFDGVDPRRVDALVAAKRLPNVAALGTKGHRGPLRTTNPPQSPVAWSAFATGMAAGHHGIFDFIDRDPRTYFPRVATSKYRQAEITAGRVSPASAENLRRGPSFWDVIARAGIPARSMSVPYAYPPPTDGARSVAGLGTPDIRGINSSFTQLTTDAKKAGGRPPAGGQWALLEVLGEGAWVASIAGPRIKIDGKRQATSVQVVVRSVGDALKIEVGATYYTVAVGATSAYVDIAFVPSPALTIQATTRFTVRSAGPAPEVYVEPMSNVPTAPYFPLANPPKLAEKQWHDHGPYKTVGWIHDTSALGEGAINEAQYLREALATMGRRAKLTLDALGEADDKILISVFTAPDRIGHMFYRYIDANHPALGNEKADSYSGALDDSYVEMDRIIGEVVKKLKPDDTLLVMSDHGFASFRRGFHLNTWLLRNGYLVMERGKRAPQQFFGGIDWTKTRAYGMGTGSIFINTQGREGRGIVDPREASALAREIGAKLLKVRDKHQPVVLACYYGDEIYVGPRRPSAPDVRVAMAPGYRASWATTLGGIEKDLFEDNTKKWSGDHASARPEDVPGILFSNKPIAVSEPRIEDLAATAYDFAGVPAPAGVIGRPLFGSKVAAEAK